MHSFHILLQKEIALYFLDRRFLVVFGFCVVLAALGVTSGARTYLDERERTATVTQTSQEGFIRNLQAGDVMSIFRTGYWWTRPPSVLSALVFGQSGFQPREGRIAYREPPTLQTSTFNTDPVRAVYGILDFSFIVTVVLSLCVLLFTHDAVCGEKEAGTLRIVSSFPVSRATLAAAKVVGGSIAVFVPLLFAFLFSATVLVLMPGLELSPGDWAKTAAILGVFGLYLAVFAAAGVLASSLCARRATAFIVLLGVWALWLFVVPNVGMRTSEWLSPATDYYDGRRQIQSTQHDFYERGRTERQALRERLNLTDWSALSETRRREIDEQFNELNSRLAEELRREEGAILQGRMNELARRNEVARWLAYLSPAGAATVVTEDLAGTGVRDLARVESILNAHVNAIDAYVRERVSTTRREPDLADFPIFESPKPESLPEILGRNVVPILGLLTMVGVGFAAAYAAILRYDVR